MVTTVTTVEREAVATNLIKETILVELMKFDNGDREITEEELNALMSSSMWRLFVIASVRFGKNCIRDFLAGEFCLGVCGRIYIYIYIYMYVYLSLCTYIYI